MWYSLHEKMQSWNFVSGSERKNEEIRVKHGLTEGNLLLTRFGSQSQLQLTQGFSYFSLFDLSYLPLWNGKQSLSYFGVDNYLTTLKTFIVASVIILVLVHSLKIL